MLINFSTFGLQRDDHQGIQPYAPQRERGSVPQATGSGTLFARDDKQSTDTIPMPTFAGRPSTVYTHSVSHAHFSDTVCLRDVQTSRTRVAQGVCSAQVIPLRLALSIPMFHPPSLRFPDGHIETTFPTSTSSSSLQNFARPERAGQAHFRTSGEEFGDLADPTHSTGCEPKEFDKITSVDSDTTPINDPNHDSISNFSKIKRENTEQFGVPLMFETSVSHVSHGEFVLQREIQESMPRETVARQRERERERKEKVL